jgi:hypothetical protein
MKERKREDAPIEEFPSINSPHIAQPVSDPPVPNRAHTDMRANGVEGLDVLTENEKASLYFKKDIIL